MSEVRTPQQERSIAKKKKIIEAGYELFSRVGYYATNTAEIAKYAGVSTGIVYGYFKDKRDILSDVIELYLDGVYRKIFKVFEGITEPIDYDTLIRNIIDTVIKVHKTNSKLHEALHSMTHTDEVISERFTALEDDITVKLGVAFGQMGMVIEGVNEKIHLAMNLVQDFSHEYVYDKHDYIDYDVLYGIVLDTIKGLFVTKQ